MKQAARISQEARPKEETGWRSFPEFERILGTEDGTVPLLAKVEKTCRQLNDILQSGSAADKARAQQAMTAYGRSLDLLRLLTDMRDASQEK